MGTLFSLVLRDFPVYRMRVYPAHDSCLQRTACLLQQVRSERTQRRESLQQVYGQERGHIQEIKTHRDENQESDRGKGPRSDPETIERQSGEMSEDDILGDLSIYAKQ